MNFVKRTTDLFLKNLSLFIFSDFISANRPNYICKTSLLRLTDDWKKRLDSEETVAVVSMDLSNAFDSIPYALLLVKLKAYGLDETSIERVLKLN